MKTETKQAVESLAAMVNNLPGEKINRAQIIRELLALPAQDRREAFELFMSLATDDGWKSITAQIGQVMAAEGYRWQPGKDGKKFDAMRRAKGGKDCYYPQELDHVGAEQIKADNKAKAADSKAKAAKEHADAIEAAQQAVRDEYGDMLKVDADNAAEVVADLLRQFGPGFSGDTLAALAAQVAALAKARTAANKAAAAKVKAADKAAAKLHAGRQQRDADAAAHNAAQGVTRPADVYQTGVAAHG